MVNVHCNQILEVPNVKSTPKNSTLIAFLPSAIHLYLLALQAPSVLSAHFRRARAWYIEQIHAGACPHCDGHLGVGRRACRNGAAAAFPVDRKAQPDYNDDVDGGRDGHAQEMSLAARPAAEADEMARLV